MYGWLLGKLALNRWNEHNREGAVKTACCKAEVVMELTVIKADRKPTMLLSHNMGEGFVSLFRSFGFDVVWDRDAGRLKEMARSSRIEHALEWQHGEEDFQIRDMLTEIGKRPRVIMARNFRIGIWSDETALKALGYDLAIDVPFALQNIKRLLRV
jgi:hypothetical protein